MPRIAADRVAVLAHGSGSTADFVTRAFGAPLAAAGWHLHALQDRSGSVHEVEGALADAVRDTGARLVGGVSLGAHAAARWAARDGEADVDGLVLVLPAWAGPAGEVAALSAHGADEVDALGPEGVLRRLDDGSWVVAELAEAWPTYGSGLASVLRATSVSPGPTLADLARISVPVGLVALVGDPFHPVEVARECCRALPQAALVELPRDAPDPDRSVLGTAALTALGMARLHAEHVPLPGPPSDQPPHR